MAAVGPGEVSAPRRERLVRHVYKRRTGGRGSMSQAHTASVGLRSGAEASSLGWLGEGARRCPAPASIGADPGLHSFMGWSGEESAPC